MNDPVARFLALLKGVRASGENSWTGLCPAHPDEHPSLSVSRGEDGRLLANCFTGCCFESILSAVGWKASDAFVDQLPSLPRTTRMKRSNNGRAFPSQSEAIASIIRSIRGRHTATWTYHDATGIEAFRVVRFDECRKGKPKQYRPMYHAADGWHVGDPPGLLPLYGLPHLIDAPEVWLCEGEKCAEILRRFGFVVTTNAHGANAVGGTDWTPLAGKTVYFAPDRGAAGEAHTRGVLDQLSRLSPASTVKVIHLPVFDDGDDIEQFVDARRAASTTDEQIRQELQEWAEAASVVEADSGLVTVKLSDVVPEEQPYLWRGRIPSSSCTLVGGRQGGTKNLFVYDLMARVTIGRPFTDEGPGMVRPPQNVILLEAEEHLV